MITDIRRSIRHQDYLPITVNAEDGTNGKKLAGPFSSRIIDISSHGARLLVSQVLINSYHIFFTTRENNSYILKLGIAVSNNKNNFCVPSRPVWMDRFHLDLHAFILGVEFLVSPDGELIKKLQQQLKKQQKKRGQWWVNMTSSLGTK